MNEKWNILSYLALLQTSVTLSVRQFKLQTFLKYVRGGLSGQYSKFEPENCGQETGTLTTRPLHLPIDAVS